MFTIISILFTAPPDINTLMLSYSIQSLVVVAGAGSEAVFACGKRLWAKYIYFATLVLFLAHFLFQQVDHPTTSMLPVLRGPFQQNKF
jgi:hypothetical protein